MGSHSGSQQASSRVVEVCKNQVIFNQFVAERMADGWTKSYVEPAQRHWPAVQGSNYEMKLQTSTFCYGRLSDSKCFTGAVTAGGENLSGVVVGNTGTSSLYSTRPPRSLQTMNVLLHILRSNVVAAVETNTTVWPWLTPRPLLANYSDEPNGGPDSRWLVEKVHHMMLSTSGVSAHLQQGLFWYNPWWENCVSPRCHAGGAQEAQIDSPHDNGALSAALYELDEVAGCADRRWVRDYWDGSRDSFALSGVDVGGRRLWRFTPDETGVAAGLASGAPASFAVTLGQPIPAFPGTNATASPTLPCTLAFESGATLRANRSWAPSVGVWVAQPAAASAFLHCPALSGPIEWPIKGSNGVA
jgi:hypothetical protein